MNKSTLGILIAIVCSGLLVAIVLVTKPKPVAQTSSSNQSATQQISAESVAQHAARDDCWMIIGKKVYDVTEYVRSHPGGSEILRGCGKDATTLFDTRRDNGERVGSGAPHSSGAKAALESFQIGVLAN